MSTIKKNSGSSLVWTVMVLGMLTVFVTTVLTMAMAFSKRTLNQNQNQQAYYTALSAVKLVSEQLQGIHEAGSAPQKIIDKLNSGDTIEITDLELPPQMGSCKVTLAMRGDDIVITADAEKSGMDYRLSGIMVGDVTVIRPEAPDYGGEDSPAIGAGGITGGTGLRTDPDTDIYIWNNQPFVMDSASNSNDAIHMGALYTKGSVELNCAKWEYTHLHGEIISTQDVILRDNATAGLLTPELLAAPPLPEGVTRCCDNADTSRIHTTGKVIMTENSSMGGDITASGIELREAARVVGNLKAGVVELQGTGYQQPQDRTVLGSIEANEVILSRDSVVVGDISAQKVTLQNNARVVGSITAEWVELSADASVAGTVTAGTLTMKNQSKIDGSVTANTLVGMQEGARITGDVATDSITIASNSYTNPAIGGGLQYCPGSSSGIEFLKSKVAGEVVVLGGKPAPVELPRRLPYVTSELPPKPSPPAMPPMPERAIPIDTSRVEVSGEEGWYRIDKGNLHIQSLRVEGDQNIFVYLPNGQTATVQEIEDDDDVPNLFFILGKGSTLHLKGAESGPAQSFPCYVWAPEGSGALLDMGRTTGLTGGIWIDKVNTADNCEFHWQPPGNPILPPEPDPDPDPDPDEGEGEGEGEGDGEVEEEIIINWGLASYENR